jgi:hypothetical protein
VTQELLDRPDIGPRRQQVSGKGMAERVRTDALGDRRGERRLADRPLDDGLVEVVATALARDAVRVDARGREDPLPGPFARCAGILDAQGGRQFDATRTGREISLMFVRGPRPDDVARALAATRETA